MKPDDPHHVQQTYICMLCVFLGVFREATTDFTVDARGLTQTGGDHIKTLISNPSGSQTDALITDHGDGTYAVEYTPYEEGGLRRSKVNGMKRFTIWIGL